MDTYTIFKVTKQKFRKLLRELNPERDEHWCDDEADCLAQEVVEECIKSGSQYPYSVINTPQTHATEFPVGPTFR